MTNDRCINLTMKILHVAYAMSFSAFTFLQCRDVVVVMESPPPLLSLADPYYKLLGIHELGNIIIYKFQYSVLHVSCFVQLNKV